MASASQHITNKLDLLDQQTEQLEEAMSSLNAVDSLSQLPASSFISLNNRVRTLEAGTQQMAASHFPNNSSSGNLELAAYCYQVGSQTSSTAPSPVTVASSPSLPSIESGPTVALLRLMTETQKQLQENQLQMQTQLDALQSQMTPPSRCQRISKKVAALAMTAVAGLVLYLLEKYAF